MPHPWHQRHTRDSALSTCHFPLAPRSASWRERHAARILAAPLRRKPAAIDAGATGTQLAHARPAMPRDEDGEGLASLILRYLDEHPDAADTAEGVRAWWLLEQVFKESVGEVQDALDSLVSRGIVTRIDRPHMPPVYRRARRNGT